MLKCDEVIDSINFYFEHYECYDPFEIISVLDELYQTTGEREFKDEINLICKDNNICPICHKSFLSGFPDDEEFDTEQAGYCTECGYGIAKEMG